jgi:hypothetical protein
MSDTLFQSYLTRLSGEGSSFWAGLSGSLGIETSSQRVRRGVAKDTVIVGYGFSYRSRMDSSDNKVGWFDFILPFVKDPIKHDLLSQRADFGWVIAPSHNLDSSGAQHPRHRLEQKTLSALISVPSWWRSVKVEVSWCWKSREDLAAATSVNLVKSDCDPKNEPHSYSLRLPGTVRDISRKLDIEVVEEPYLRTPWRQSLEVGRPGRLILTGGRLWRSTRVSLDNQIADSIEVLPDMSGLMVKFDCVERPVGWKSELQRIYDRTPRSTPNESGEPQKRRSGRSNRAEVRVWTSEGAADGYPVEMLPFSSEIGESPCYARRMLAGKRGMQVKIGSEEIAQRYIDMYDRQMGLAVAEKESAAKDEFAKLYQ